MTTKMNPQQLGEWLILCIEEKDDASAQRALRLGADLTLSDKNGMSALCHAAQTGQTNITRQLIAKGANVDFQDFTKGFGLTPIMRACFDGQKETADLLLDAKANVNLQDGEGRAALFMASHFDGLCGRSVMVAKLLKKSEPDVNMRTYPGTTVLMNNFSCPENIKLLIAAGADINAKNKQGQTAYDRVRGTLLNGAAARVYEGIYDEFKRVAAKAHEDLLTEAVSVMMDGTTRTVNAMPRIRLKRGWSLLF